MLEYYLKLDKRNWKALTKCQDCNLRFKNQAQWSKHRN